MFTLSQIPICTGLCISSQTSSCPAVSSSFKYLQSHFEINLYCIILYEQIQSKGKWLRDRWETKPLTCWGLLGCKVNWQRCTFVWNGAFFFFLEIPNMLIVIQILQNSIKNKSCLRGSIPLAFDLWRSPTEFSAMKGWIFYNLNVQYCSC